MTDTNHNIEEMIASGELGTMTECAYGSAIADSEAENILKTKKLDKSKQEETKE